MHIIRNEKQKDNLAKYSYDLSKIIFAVVVISPFAKPESFDFLFVLGGFIVGFIFLIIGNILDIKEV